MSQTADTRSAVTATCRDCDWFWPVPTGKTGRPRGQTGTPISRCRAATTKHVDTKKHRVRIRLTGWCVILLAIAAALTARKR